MATTKRKTTVSRATKAGARPTAKKAGAGKATAPAKKKGKSGPKSSAGKPAVDANRKHRWEAAIERYRSSRTQEVAGWDERFEALGEILEEELYLAAGFKTARDFLRAEVPDQDERSVRRAIRVARYFDPDDETRYGITRLDGVLDYLEATGGAPLAPAKIRLDRMQIQVRRDKKDRKLAFADVTVQELQAATRAARGKTSGAAKTSPLVKAVRAALAKAKLGAVAVSLRDQRVVLSNIEPDALAQLAKALAGFKVPAGV